MSVATFFPFLVALGAALLLTPVGIWAARRLGQIERPRADRWSQREVARLGGVAIFLSIELSLLLFAPRSLEVYGLLLGCALIFTLGLWDDIRPLRPAHKLVGQILIACLGIAFGIRASFGGELASYSEVLPFLAIPLTVLWIVGITNAFNLLDNMDGLSSGVAGIASSFVVVLGLIKGDATTTVVGMALAGSSFGFLVYNFNPARVFMGDAGSLMLGFLLASTTLIGTWQDASNLSLVLAVPVLLLGVPIFDTTLVTVLRKIHGRPASQGGRDHSSHRLVALGLSERKAVLVLYAICLSLGLVALAGYAFDRFVTGVAVGFLAIFLLVFGIILADVKVYREVPLGPGDGKERVPILNTLLLHKRRLVEVLCDFLLACLAYLCAYLLRFEGVISTENARLIGESLPLVALAKLVAFTGLGVYSGAWKYVGLRDALVVAKAVVAGEVLGVLLLLGISRFVGYSRALFVLDALLFALFTIGIRFFWRIVRETLLTFPTRGRRVVVMGKNGSAAALLNILQRDRSLGLRPVAVFDDDPQLAGRKLYGVPVLSPPSTRLLAALKRFQFEEILVAPASSDSLLRVATLGRELGIPVRAIPTLSSSLVAVPPELLTRLEEALFAPEPDIAEARKILAELRATARLSAQPTAPPVMDTSQEPPAPGARHAS